MLNGAVTLGTVDGANVEIAEIVGEDNIFTFGLRADEVTRAWNEGYNGSKIYSSDPAVRRVVDRLKTGFAGESFADIAAYLTIGAGGVADPYMCLADFRDYLRAASDMDAAYRDPMRFNRMALVNISGAGAFAADRSIREYAQNIWHLGGV